MKHTFSSIETGIEELKKGNMLIVLDDPEREDQADLIFPAEIANEEKINFMMQKCRGFICAPITRKQAAQLSIPLMVPPQDNTEKTRLNFGVTVDARDVTSFGISASDRARTINTLADENATMADFVRPGHVFTIIAAEGGVEERAGHTEATIELVERAGYKSAGVLCEIINEKGNPSTGNELFEFAKKYNLKIVTTPDLIKYVKEHPKEKQKQPYVTRVAEANLPTDYGMFKIVIYKSILDNREHAILVKGEVTKEPALTRIHSQCLTGDTFHSQKCDCGGQLEKSLEMICQKGSGVLLYLNQEGRGIGLTNKIKAYALQEKGLDTEQANIALDLPVDARDYNIAAEILRDLGVSHIELLTNNPDKIEQMETYGIIITKRIPVEIAPNKFDKQYLETKKSKFHHQLTEV
jgi:3,4-dihydroxy 2-butanone 4-phosphate synthase/GTP cyclohydrolase II